MSGPLHVIRIDFGGAGAWTNVSQWVDRYEFSYGFADTIPVTIANLGQLTLTLDNRDKRFSPANTLSPYYGQLLPGKRVEVWLNHNPNDLTFPSGYIQKFAGEIETIQPSSSSYKERQVAIQASDLIGKLSRTAITLPIQQGRRSDETAQAVINEALGCPPARMLVKFTNTPTNGHAVVLYMTGHAEWRLTWNSSYPVTTPEQVWTGTSALQAAVVWNAALNGLDLNGQYFGVLSRNHKLVANFNADTVTIQGASGGYAGYDFALSTDEPNLALIPRNTGSSVAFSGGSANWPESDFNRLVANVAGGATRYYRCNDFAISVTTAIDTGTDAQNGTYGAATLSGQPGLLYSDADPCCFTGGASPQMTMPLSNKMVDKRFALVFWVKPLASGSSFPVGLFDLNDGTGSAFTQLRLSLASNGALTLDYGGGNTLATAAGAVAIDGVNMIAVDVNYTAGSQSTQIYVNGLQAATANIGRVNNVPTSIRWLTANTFNAFYGFYGKLALFMNDQILGAGVVKQLYYSQSMASFERGIQTFTYAGQGWDQGQTKALEALRQIVTNEGGRLWARGDGVVVFHSRDYLMRQSTLAASMTINNDGPELFSGIARKAIYNKVVITTGQPSLLASGPIAKATGLLTVPGGGSLSVSLPFADPTTGLPCSALSLTLPPVVGTDWIAALDATGYGADFYTYTRPDYISIAVTDLTATQITLNITNTATGPLVMTLLQVRGIGIVEYNTVDITREDTASQKTYGQVALAVNMSLNNDIGFAASYAQYLLDRYKAPTFNVDTMRFPTIVQNPVTGVFSGGGGQAVTVIDLEPERVIVASDAQIGISNQRYAVLAVRFKGDPERLDVEADVERVDDRYYALVDSATADGAAVVGV